MAVVHTARRCAPKMPLPKNSRPSTSAISADAVIVKASTQTVASSSHSPRSSRRAASMTLDEKCAGADYLPPLAAYSCLPFWIAAHSSADWPPISSTSFC